MSMTTSTKLHHFALRAGIIMTGPLNELVS
jgi:hypothetical protein